MELRWLEEGTEKRLQYRYYGMKDDIPGSSTPWTDVPTVKEEKKVWCGHMLWEPSKSYPENVRWWLNLVVSGHKLKVEDNWTVCPICGTPKPKE